MTVNGVSGRVVHSDCKRCERACWLSSRVVPVRLVFPKTPRNLLGTATEWTKSGVRACRTGPSEIGQLSPTPTDGFNLGEDWLNKLHQRFFGLPQADSTKLVAATEWTKSGVRACRTGPSEIGQPSPTPTDGFDSGEYWLKRKALVTNTSVGPNAAVS